LANEFKSVDATAVVADGGGGAWIGTSGQGLVHVTASGDWSRRRTGDPVPDNWPVAVAYGPEGDAWIAFSSTTYSGVVRREAGGAWTAYRIPDELAWVDPPPVGQATTLRQVEDIAVDGGGALWAAAGESVLSLAPDRVWRLVDQPDVLTDMVTTVTAAPDGSVWFGTWTGAVIHEADGEWRRLETNLTELETEVLSVAFDRAGRPCLSTASGVAWQQADSSWRFYPAADEAYGAAFVMAAGLAIDEHDRAWVAADNALGVFADSGTFGLVGKVDGRELSTEWGSGLVADPRGNGIWAAAVRLATDPDSDILPFDGGLVRRQSPDRWAVFGPWDGLGSMAIRDLAADPLSGDLLVATEGGVARLSTTQLPADTAGAAYLPSAYRHGNYKPRGEVDPDEYAVYRAAIEHLYGDAEYERYVILDRTARWIDADYGYFGANLPTLTRETYDDYEGRNQVTWPLVDAFGLTTPVVLVGRAELAEIFADGGWDEFYRRYPGAQGEMMLSRVGFDAGRTQALVYVGNQSHYLAGVGLAALLERTPAGWKVVGTAMLWIS
jgi:DNA-binding transcriptional regulator/RsmH inhibitor MraZ